MMTKICSKLTSVFFFFFSVLLLRLLWIFKKQTLFDITLYLWLIFPKKLISNTYQLKFMYLTLLMDKTNNQIFYQSDSPIGGSFWPKIILITHMYTFWITPLLIFSAVCLLMRHPLLQTYHYVFCFIATVMYLSWDAQIDAKNWGKCSDLDVQRILAKSDNTKEASSCLVANKTLKTTPNLPFFDHKPILTAVHTCGPLPE